MLKGIPPILGPDLLHILRAMGQPLAVTSANRSGHPDAVTGAAARREGHAVEIHGDGEGPFLGALHLHHLAEPAAPCAGACTRRTAQTSGRCWQGRETRWPPVTGRRPP